MKAFMDKDFLLTTDTAKRLYHEVAAEQPIFDYHCHLPPEDIAADRRFANLAQVWLGGDHYKWRQMRTNGVDERLITGDAPAYDKFMAWAAAVPALVGNPLYHWTHLELQRYFGVFEPLDESTAPAIWDQANRALAGDDLSVYGIFRNFKVYAVGTTDDPADTLEWHRAVRAAGKTATKVLPSFRPDKVLYPERPGYADYLARLGAAAGVRVDNLADLQAALANRVAYFDSLGCRASDHALETPPFALGAAAGAPAAAQGAALESAAAAVCAAALDGRPVGPADAEVLRTHLLVFLAGEYAARGWAMQLHLAALRNNNSARFASLGPDTGYDAVHDLPVAAKLAGLLDLMEKRGALPKTILYSLNPKDYYSLGTLMGCFQGGIPGKIQLGSAWWFCDHRDGMLDQLRILGNLGMLPRFIGMLTDSRSFLSYPRHEYFRRILCELVGGWAEAGEIPASPKLLDRIVADVSFGNAVRYFAG
jgi:glucuronate isomerase